MGCGGRLLTVCGLPLKARQSTKAGHIRLHRSSQILHKTATARTNCSSPTVLPCAGREDRSGFHDHRQLHSHFSKGCYLHLHPLCTHFPASGSSNQYLHSRSSKTCVSGWWGAYVPVAATAWAICLGEAYELCFILGAPVLVGNFKLFF